MVRDQPLGLGPSGAACALLMPDPGSMPKEKINSAGVSAPSPRWHLGRDKNKQISRQTDRQADVTDGSKSLPNMTATYVRSRSPGGAGPQALVWVSVMPQSLIT